MAVPSKWIPAALDSTPAFFKTKTNINQSINQSTVKKLVVYAKVNEKCHQELKLKYKSN